jgi:aspartate-semialdehyde dehydrogenase
MVVALRPIQQKYGLERVHVATYQAVSGVGYQAMVQLEEESLQKLAGGSHAHGDYESQFPHPIGFNLIPQVDSFLDSGYTKEEMKMVNETRKILVWTTSGYPARACVSRYSSGTPRTAS